jgi:integrase
MLRHFFCSQAQNVAGYSIAETAQQAGHASTKTTLRYSHPNRQVMIEKANKL